jgi:hypothetical protein
MRHKLWDMYVDTYQGIGLHIESESKLTSKYKVSWLIDIDADPDPFIIYKETPHGNKLALMGTDGSSLAKRTLLEKAISLLKSKKWFAEASHKVADIFRAKGVPVITGIDTIKKLTGKSDVIETDNPEIYKRKLGTMGMVKKTLFGTI